jgi:hypothetical protein
LRPEIQSPSILVRRLSVVRDEGRRSLSEMAMHGQFAAAGGRAVVAADTSRRDAVVTRERENWRETVRTDETGKAWQTGKSARNAWSRNSRYMFNGIKRLPCAWG